MYQARIDVIKDLLKKDNKHIKEGVCFDAVLIKALEDMLEETLNKQAEHETKRSSKGVF